MVLVVRSDLSMLHLKLIYDDRRDDVKNELIQLTALACPARRLRSEKLMLARTV